MSPTVPPISTITTSTGLPSGAVAALRAAALISLDHMRDHLYPSCPDNRRVRSREMICS